MLDVGFLCCHYMILLDVASTDYRALRHSNIIIHEAKAMLKKRLLSFWGKAYLGAVSY